jgi:hypothetical protein
MAAIQGGEGMKSKAIRLLYATILDSKGKRVLVAVYENPKNGTVTTFVRRGTNPKSAITHKGKS